MRRHSILLALGVVSIALYLGLWNISLNFNWGEGYEQRPILTYMGMYFALFILYALGATYVWKTPENKNTFLTIIIFGLLFRAAIMPAQQIQEDDIYRYLWDGKVFSHGINPYKYTPEQVDSFKELLVRDPVLFQETYDDINLEELLYLYDLKWENDTARVFKERINHPDVPTIYPPLAQYVFRIIHDIKPDSILTMRLGFLFFDLLALIFIILTLKKLGLNRNFCLLYFWSPLVIKETFNSTHLDIIGLSFLCVSIYWLVNKRYSISTVFLALSVLGKLYPIILFPLYLKQAFLAESSTSSKRFTQPLICTGIFGLVIGAFYFPFIKIGEGAFEGLRVFSTYWQSNDSIFALLTFFFGKILVFLNIDSQNEFLFSYDVPSMLSKLTVMAILGSTLLYLLYRPTKSVLQDVFLIMTMVFLLSPVQNPWYLCWVVPFLCFYKWRSLILLTGLVSIYYMEFYLDYQEIPQFLPWLPWVEYTPFYLFLAWEVRKKFRESKMDGNDSATSAME
ncbi:MAG: hypothetical protein ACQ9MH_07955 [Nitrospinales bacterium]